MKEEKSQISRKWDSFLLSFSLEISRKEGKKGKKCRNLLKK